ncbi:OsmC/Ohr family [Dendryphion nanum]|uniref:OsmC/Ohr family n=1 Tax=Dendryphion nanum TaxID=256645 RepID=A0A9P9ITI4_9PLEO|nr:OsmC/Ohr family [Dendryphion nanum]
MSTAAQTLREKQAPIKSSYRENPASAIITLKSTGSLDSSSITCKLDNGPAVKEAHKVAGLHPKAGGPNPEISGELCSGDMLLDALVACAGVTLKAVATAIGIPIETGSITAEGDLDFRGTLGVDRSAPVGITGIRLAFDLQFGAKADGTNVTEQEVESLGKLTERYCVVLQTLVKKPEISVKIVGNGRGKEEEGVKREVTWAQTI